MASRQNSSPVLEVLNLIQQELGTLINIGVEGQDANEWNPSGRAIQDIGAFLTSKTDRKVL